MLANVADFVDWVVNIVYNVTIGVKRLLQVGIGTFRVTSGEV